MKIGSMCKRKGGGQCYYLGSINRSYYFVGDDLAILRTDKLPKNSGEVTLEAVKKYTENYPERGQYFRGTDDQEYVFLSFGPNKPILVKFMDPKTKNIYQSAGTYIKDKLEKFDELVMSERDIITKKNLPKKISDKELVQIGLSIFRFVFDSVEGFEILEVGPIIHGEGYYHEVDKHYPITGLVIKHRTKMLLGEEIIVEDGTGFFAIQIEGKYLTKAYPFDFIEGNSDDVDKAYYFSNGYGDHFEKMGIYISKERVVKALEEINYSLYEKRGL